MQFEKLLAWYLSLPRARQARASKLATLLYNERLADSRHAALAMIQFGWNRDTDGDFEIGEDDYLP